MRKFIIWLLVGVMLLGVCGCENGKDSSETQKLDDSSQIESSVDWCDYLPSGATNVTSVGYSDQTGSNTYKCVDAPTEQTVGFHTYVMCPYCKDETFIIFKFDELPTEKLGDSSILIQKDELCWNWANHPSSFDSNYTVSILLTLNK